MKSIKYKLKVENFLLIYWTTSLLLFFFFYNVSYIITDAVVLNTLFVTRASFLRYPDKDYRDSSDPGVNT